VFIQHNICTVDLLSNIRFVSALNKLMTNDMQNYRALTWKICVFQNGIHLSTLVNLFLVSLHDLVPS
jgi:hypothetical protein